MYIHVMSWVPIILELRWNWDRDWDRFGKGLEKSLNVMSGTLKRFRDKSGKNGSGLIGSVFKI